MTMVEAGLAERVRSARSLPSPPVVVARLIRMCEDPDTGIDRIVDVLGTDAALTARLLRLANSPLHARRRRTENLRQAVMLLGIDAVLTASLSLTLLSGRSTSSAVSEAFTRKRWARSVHAAATAQLLAERLDAVSPSDAFLAALLQDIGVQVVASLEPDTYRALPDDCTHDDLVAAELDRLGVDHSRLGAELLDSWNLPPRIVEAVGASHGRDGDHHGVLDCGDAGSGGHAARADRTGVAPDASTALARTIGVAGFVADGVAGEPGALDRAATEARSALGLADEAFAAVIEQLGAVLPDLALVLDAPAPDPDVLAEMAEEIIVLRQARTQAVAIELNERLAAITSVAEQLELESRLDPLTGLSNRRDLDHVLAREFEMATRHGFPLSVLFVDLDDFKLVNDRFGHTIGDEMLVQSARRVSGTVRDGDVVGRFGGEEFVVVLPGTDAASCELVAQRLVDRFGSHPFDLGDGCVVHQTVSIGAATLDRENPFPAPSALLSSADAALYGAKGSGKNRFRHRCAPIA